MLFLTCSRLIAANIILDIVLLVTYKKGIKIWCTNRFKKCYYFVLASLMIDYKEQVLIIGMKANIQYFIYHILPKKSKMYDKKVGVPNP